MKKILIISILLVFKADNCEDLIKKSIHDKLREFPKRYLDQAIKYFKEKNGKVIVEIGSIRVPFSHDVDKETCIFCADGHSTYLWARTLAEVYTVDNDPAVHEIVRKACKGFKNVQIINQDGIEFLKKFPKKIDLLFLDAWNVIEGSDYAEKHLEAYQAAKDKLHNKSMILIDDTDIDDGGKGKLIIPKALEDGFKIIFTGRQTLLMK